MSTSFCRLTVLALCLGSSLATAAKADSMQLRRDLQHIVEGAKGKVGISFRGLDFKAGMQLNGDKHMPMQSVYKFPLAMYILRKADEGKLSLTQQVHIVKARLDTNTWSPMVTDHPAQDIDITLGELLKYSVSKSDNNACDILFWLAGGTAPVDSYIHSLGITGMAIAATEAEMSTSSLVQYTNWCEPRAMVQLLSILYKGTALSAQSNRLLMTLMTESENSENRLKAGLPDGAVLAHKTGTSATNKKEMTAANNDAGIVTMPNGRHYAVVVYLSDYKGNAARGDYLIASISKKIFAYCNAMPKW